MEGNKIAVDKKKSKYTIHSEKQTQKFAGCILKPSNCQLQQYMKNQRLNQINLSFQSICCLRQLL